MTWESDKVRRARETIEKYLGRYGLLAPEESDEIERAYAALREAQWNCHHTMEPYTSFSKSVRKCRYCHYEDPS